MHAQSRKALFVLRISTIFPLLNTRDNKKQKHQENAILLTITETPLPQLIALSDPIPTPTDPLLETLAIPTSPQIVHNLILWNLPLMKQLLIIPTKNKQLRGFMDLNTTYCRC